MGKSLEMLFTHLDQQIQRLLDQRHQAEIVRLKLVDENSRLQQRLEAMEARLTDVIAHIQALTQAEPLANAAPSPPEVAVATDLQCEKGEEPSDAFESPATANGSAIKIAASASTASEKVNAIEPQAPTSSPASNHFVDDTATQSPPSPQQLLQQWYQRYPQAFFTAHTRPLQIGIHEALVAAEPWPTRLVRRALACYVNLPRYIKSLRPGVERIDLAGQAAGRVTDDEAQHAREQLHSLQEQQQLRERAVKERRMQDKLDALKRQHQH